MVATAKISSGGKIGIPSRCRETLNLKACQKVLVDVQNNSLVICSFQCALQKVRHLIKQHHSGGSLVDQLIAERREEALKDG